MKYSLAPFIIRRPWLYKIFKPAASWYMNASGYRQMGLRYANFFSPLGRPVRMDMRQLGPI
jgi:ubiquinol-cytochrome c reductase subunit 7